MTIELIGKMGTMDQGSTISEPVAAAAGPIDVAIATSAEDAAAVDAVERHHEELASRLSGLVTALVAAAGRVGIDGFGPADQKRGELVRFCEEDLVPHAKAEEGALYPAAAAHDEAAMLVESMIAEHRVILSLVDQLETFEDPVRTAGIATALLVLFETHLTKENDFVLPLVAADPKVSLAEILSGMHELLGHESAHEHSTQASSPASGCGCGCSCGN